MKCNKYVDVCGQLVAREAMHVFFVLSERCMVVNCLIRSHDELSGERFQFHDCNSCIFLCFPVFMCMYIHVCYAIIPESFLIITEKLIIFIYLILRYLIPVERRHHREDDEPQQSDCQPGRRQATKLGHDKPAKHIHK